jgi:hypothetical protein
LGDIVREKFSHEDEEVGSGHFGVAEHGDFNTEGTEFAEKKKQIPRYAWDDNFWCNAFPVHSALFGFD